MENPANTPNPEQTRRQERGQGSQGGVNPPAENPDIGVDYSNRMANDNELGTRLQTMRNRIQRGVGGFGDDAELRFGLNSYDVITNLLLLALNGQSELPEQKVRVEYLRGTQQLVIPTAMMMNPLTGIEGRVPKNIVLVNRYWQATRLPYRDAREMILAQRTQIQIRDAVHALAATARQELYTEWNQPAWNTENDAPEYVDMIMGAISAALQFNCDVRDTGILTRASMIVGDYDWADLTGVTRERLMCKIKAMSIQMIAALNYAPAGRYDISAYVRAFGVGIGILPAVESRTQIEWRCTVSQPLPDDLRAVQATSDRLEGTLFALCANVLAMFGVFHLAKDHTFRTGDPEMMRIGASYIQTLRTMTSQNELDKLLQHQESIVRTAAHPFALAQTYWLARSMHKFGLLSAPLAIRIDATPPPVQRLMIVKATIEEWANLPAGIAVDRNFGFRYPALYQEATAIVNNAPAYSALHRLYGINEQRLISDEVQMTVSSMMPTVYGYIAVTHKEEGGKRDGLGLAMSLENVKRDQKGLTALWQNAWAKYVNVVDEIGLMEFIESMKVPGAAGAAGQ